MQRRIRYCPQSCERARDVLYLSSDMPIQKEIEHIILAVDGRNFASCTYHIMSGLSRYPLVPPSSRWGRQAPGVVTGRAFERKKFCKLPDPRFAPTLNLGEGGSVRKTCWPTNEQPSGKEQLELRTCKISSVNCTAIDISNSIAAM